MNTYMYYDSNILPIFDYGCLIWGRCSSGNSLRRVPRMILKADIILRHSVRLTNYIGYLFQNECNTILALWYTKP